MCKMSTNLMGSSGVQPDSDKRNVLVFAICQNLVGQQRPLHVLAGSVYDARFSKRAVVPEQILHLTGSILEPSVHDGEIFFLKHTLSHLFG